MFLLRHAELFRTLHTWTVRVLVPRRFWKAAVLYKAALRDELWTPLEPHIRDLLETYFRERRADRWAHQRPVGRVPHQGVPPLRDGAVRQPVSSVAAHGRSHSQGRASTILRDARERGWGACEIQPLRGQYLQLTGLIDRDGSRHEGSQAKKRRGWPPCR